MRDSGKFALPVWFGKRFDFSAPNKHPELGMNGSRKLILCLSLVVSALWTPKAGAVPVSLLFEGITLSSDSPFAENAPFSIELTYDSSEPRSFYLYPGDTGPYYENAASSLSFNYNQGEYVGETSSADVLIVHGATFGLPASDIFWVTGIDGEGFPALDTMTYNRTNSAFGVQADFGDSFQDSTLPLSLSSPPFVALSCTFVWMNSSLQTVRFNGEVISVKTVPEPSTMVLSLYAVMLAGMVRTFTRASRTR